MIKITDYIQDRQFINLIKEIAEEWDSSEITILDHGIPVLIFNPKRAT